MDCLMGGRWVCGELEVVGWATCSEALCSNRRTGLRAFWHVHLLDMAHCCTACFVGLLFCLGCVPTLAHCFQACCSEELCAAQWASLGRRLLYSRTTHTLGVLCTLLQSVGTVSLVFGHHYVLHKTLC